MTRKIYKIVCLENWQQAREAGFFAGSDDDCRDGFIHLSTSEQIAGTAERHFRNVRNLVLVAFDADGLGSGLRWEVSRDGALFPHYYGALPVSLALWQRDMTLDDRGVPRVDLGEDDVV